MKRLWGIKCLLFVLCVCSFQTAFAQRETLLNLQNFESETRFNWGYSLGVGSWNYKLTPVSGSDSKISLEKSVGFSVGLIGMLNINRLLDIRLEPSLHFVSRSLNFQNANIEQQLQNFKVSSTYLDLPVLLHFRGARWNNVRPFIASGLGYIRNLQAKETSSDDASKGVFRTTVNNFAWQAEAGIEFYFKRFKMTSSIKGIFFINDEHVPDNPETAPYWNGAISGLRSRAVMFSLKFE